MLENGIQQDMSIDNSTDDSKAVASAIKRDIILASVEGTREIAQRNILRDEEGAITDIAFTQGGNTATLREVLPGDYKLNTWEPKPGQHIHMFSSYNGEKNMVTFPIGPLVPENDGNLVLLHEVGHARDLTANKAKYVLVTINRVREYGRRQLITLKQKDSVLEEDKLQTLLEQEEGRQGNTFLQPEDYDALKTELVAYYQNLPTDQDELAKLADDASLATKRSFVRDRVVRERGAWAQALHAMRKLRQRGINVFDSGNTGIFAFVDSMLAMGYQLDEGKYLLPDDKQFVPKSKPEVLVKAAKEDEETQRGLEAVRKLTVRGRTLGRRNSFFKGPLDEAKG